MPLSTWIDTLNARRDAAAEPRSLEELFPGPATQPALAPAGPSKTEVTEMIASEVGAQMDAFMNRLEGLFAPPAVPTGPSPAVPAPAPPAQSVPAPVPTPSAAVTAPETASVGENPPGRPGAENAPEVS